MIQFLRRGEGRALNRRAAWKRSRVVLGLRLALGLPLALAFALGLGDTAVAQTAIGPRPAPPPSYGPPFSPAMQGYEISQFSSGFNFRFVVALTELQKFLPAGYTAIPSAPGATTANVSAIFSQKVMLTLTAPVGGFAAGTYGPFETFDLVAAASPPPGSPNAFESVFLVRFANNSEIVDIRTAFGVPGETRLADIDVRIREGFGELRMRGRVDDPDFGLKVAATMTGAAEVALQFRQFGPLALRTVDSTVSPPTVGTVGLFTVSADNSAVLTDPAALDVNAQQVRLSGGKMKILSAAPGNFFLNQEVYFKRQ